MKVKPFEATLILALVALAVAIGWMLTADATRDRREKANAEDEGRRAPLTMNSVAEQKTVNVPKKSKQEQDQDALFAIPNERLIRFGSEEEYRRFLASLDGSNLRLLGSIDGLRAVRVGFDNLSDLDGLLSDDQLGYNYLVSLPLPPEDGTIQEGAIGFNGNALAWLGISGDNSAWGEGVKVAVIDTGISAHSALSDDIVHYNLVGDEGVGVEFHGHGTAVASLIAGLNGVTPGVSPSATLIDVRVADSSGSSSSFLLAEGIVTAVDAGANVINISMGSYGDSALVQDAVTYASDKGVVIVASSGNEGLTTPAYPAAYDDVIAVGAVDSEGLLVDFSNTGSTLDITAPGLSVYAAWTDDKYIEFTGTSASAPYVAAAIATGMSEFNTSSTSSATLVTTYANEAGVAGTDNSYGVGLLDVGRVINSETPGIYDVAAVSNLLSITGDSVMAIVQNQGTATINNATATVSTPFEDIPLTIPSLAPGEIQTFEFSLNIPDGYDNFLIETSTSLSPTFEDFDPSNNVKSTDLEQATISQ